MHETTTKRPGRAGKYIRRALLALAAVILAAVLVLLGNFIADMLYTVADPRIRVSKGKGE